MNNSKKKFVLTFFIKKVLIKIKLKVYLYLHGHSDIYKCLLFLFIYITYSVYTSPMLLCDDSDDILRVLTQLKFNLSYEVSNYRTHNIAYEYLVDIKRIGEDLPMENRNFEDERYLAGKVHSKLSDMNGSLNKIRSIESEIRKLDPNFQSPMRAIYYPRVGR